VAGVAAASRTPTVVKKAADRARALLQVRIIAILSTPHFTKWIVLETF
jgi:hypothetical protein